MLKAKIKNNFMISIREHNVLIVIPAFNEEKNIVSILRLLFKEHPGIDILVVNDGSTDKTADYASREKAIVLNHPFNMGIGVSFQTGCCFALRHGYKFIVRIDGDGQHDPSFINAILTPIINGEVDIAVGSRFLGESKFKSVFLRRIGIFIISGFLRLVTKKRFTDPTSGFCAMNKKAYSFFAESCVEDYPEPEILIHHRDFRIKEVPVSMTKRVEGMSSINNLKSMYYMYKVLFLILLSMFRKE